MRFEGSVAFVTGAGSGIGRATARRLAAEVADGKIIEAWEEYEELGMRRQLGVLPGVRPGS